VDRLLCESMTRWLRTALTYHLRDFKLEIGSEDGPRHQHEEFGRQPLVRSGTLSQSEHDWAYAKRALARGDGPEEVMRRIADFRAADKHDPEYYARHTVTKAQRDFDRGRASEQGIRAAETEGPKQEWSNLP
jgi:hypothetical protein